MHFIHVSRSVGWRPIVVALWATSAFGQTTIDLARQARNVDFSGAVSTRPSKTGTALPATCNIGETFFLTSASAGSNWYGCAAANSWALQGGGTIGVTTPPASLNQFTATSSGAVLTINATCSISIPCVARVGSTSYAFTATAIATLIGGSGVAHIYIDSTGILTIGHTFGNTSLSCNGACVAINGVTAFPSGSIPLWTWTGTLGTWDTGGMTDFRSFMSAGPVITATSGISLTQSPGVLTLAVDGVEVPYFSSAEGLPSAAGQSAQIYLVTDGANASDCSAGGGNYAVFCKSNGTAWSALTLGGGGGGTGGGVSSVALALPSFITVSGSPVTTSGTLSGSLASQSPNTFFAGPATGSSAAPVFRTLLTADIPNPGGDLTGTYGTTVVAGINGAVVPAAAPCVGTNSQGQLVSATCGGGDSGLPTLLYSDMLDSSSIASPYEQSIKSWSLPANTLATDGAALQVDAWVRIVAATGSVTMSFGGADIYAGLNSAANTLIEISCLIRRTTASSEYAFCRVWHGSNIATFAFDNASLAADLTLPQTIAVRGLDGNTSAGDIIVRGWTVNRIAAH